MLNYETLLSAYDDKLTLMQWLKKVEAALKDASAVSFNVNKRGDATLTFSVVFEDGSEIESNPITLQQGESVASAAISNGHLLLTLTNGVVLDSGNLFNGNVELNGNLKVNGLATLPSIEGDENGDINVDGDIIVSEGGISISDGAVSTPILTSQNEQIEAQKPVVEVMTGYTYSKNISENVAVTYASAVKNGNKITLVIAGRVSRASAFTTNLGTFHFPLSVANKIIPSYGNYVANSRCALSTEVFSTSFSKNYGIEKIGNEYFSIYLFGLNSDLVADTEYMFRIEATFLLSGNLAA